MTIFATLDREDDDSYHQDLWLEMQLSPYYNIYYHDLIYRQLRKADNAMMVSMLCLTKWGELNL